MVMAEFMKAREPDAIAINQRIIEAAMSSWSRHRKNREGEIASCSCRPGPRRRTEIEHR